MTMMDVVFLRLDFTYSDNGFVEELSDQVMIYAKSHSNILFALKEKLNEEFKILPSSKNNSDNTLNLQNLNDKRKCKLSYYMKRDGIVLSQTGIQALEPNLKDLGVGVFTNNSSKKNTDLGSLTKYPFFDDLFNRIIPF